MIFQNVFRARCLRGMGISTAILLSLISTTGCSQPKKVPTFTSLEELQSAYTAAGGECVSTTPFAAVNEDYGIHGVSCGNNDDAIAWFEDATAKSDFLSIIEGAGSKYVLGANWLVITDQTQMIVDALGGEVRG